MNAYDYNVMRVNMYNTLYRTIKKYDMIRLFIVNFALGWILSLVVAAIYAKKNA